MSTSTEFLGLIKPELTDAADITAMNENWDKVDNEVMKSRGTNPNLLDNWYFADPINQRAQTSYSGSGYGIDRWTMIEADGSVTLEDGGITVYRQIRQYIENPNDVFNKQITASVLTSDGTLHTGTMTPTNSNGGQLIVDDTDIHLYMYILTNTADGNVSFIIECREAVTIQAAKLEFGSQQTLAIQDENGDWVLNMTPPNKTLETIKCNSSTDDATDDYANQTVATKQDVNKITPEAIGAAKIVCGSYKGTGTWGKDNPNTLSFDFIPKLLIVSGYLDGYGLMPNNDGVYWSESFIWYKGQTKTKNMNVVITFETSDKAVSWYADSAIGQLNTSGETFNYIAIG